MSRGNACVRFDDGTVLYTLYNGTSDVLISRLWPTIQEAWEGYRACQDLFPEPVGEPEHVIIHSDYGFPEWWEGTATRNAVIGPLDLMNDNVETRRGTPDWVDYRWKDA